MAEFAGINSSINIGLPASVPENFQNPEVRALYELMSTVISNFHKTIEQYVGITQKDITLWSSLQPTDTLLRHQAGRLYTIAGENLSAGHLINLYADAGLLKARRADAAAGLVKPCHGYCSTSGGILSGETGEFILSQGILAISGVTVGQLLFLSTTPGLATASVLSGAGQLRQFIGIGVATDLAYIDIATGPYLQF